MLNLNIDANVGTLCVAMVDCDRLQKRKGKIRIRLGMLMLGFSKPYQIGLVRGKQFDVWEQFENNSVVGVL